MNFKGKDEMIRKLDAAVDGECPQEITDCVRNALCEMVDSGRIRLPDCVFEPGEDHYARRELHRDDERGYSVMAMTWGPGQGTPVHDHSGMWCVEAVWQGNIEVVQYELMEESGQRARLEPRTTMRAGVGSAGSLIPPHEHHTICNPDDREVAVTVHIYSGHMNSCCVFDRESGNWYRRKEKQLGLDSQAVG